MPPLCVRALGRCQYAHPTASSPRWRNEVRRLGQDLVRATAERGGSATHLLASRVAPDAVRREADAEEDEAGRRLPVGRAGPPATGGGPDLLRDEKPAEGEVSLAKRACGGTRGGGGLRTHLGVRVLRAAALFCGRVEHRGEMARGEGGRRSGESARARMQGALGRGCRERGRAMRGAVGIIVRGFVEEESGQAGEEDDGGAMKKSAPLSPFWSCTGGCSRSVIPSPDGRAS